MEETREPPESGRESIGVTPQTGQTTYGRATRASHEVRPPKRLIDEMAEIVSMVAEDPDMPTITQALRGPESQEWPEAMHKEIDSLERYNTWQEVLPSEGTQFVNTKYKAHLNAQGFTQIPSLHFDKPFAAVVHTDTIQFLLAHAVQEGLYTAQFDVEFAYLNALGEEELYLKPPQGVRVTRGRVLWL